MPQFTEGMSKLVSQQSHQFCPLEHLLTSHFQIRDENWILRGKIKKAAVRVVDRAYGLHPSDSRFSASNSKDLRAEKREYIAQKVERLIGPSSPYLRGP